MTCLLTAVGLTPVASSTVHIYTQTVHRTTQNKQYIELHKNLGRVRAVPHLCEFCPGICLTTQEKGGTAVAQWLRCCATNRKVACSILAGVIGNFL